MGHYGTWSHRVTSHHGAASQPPGHRLRLRPCPRHPGQQEDHGGQGGQAQRTAQEGWVLWVTSLQSFTYINHYLPNPRHNNRQIFIKIYLFR